MCSEADIRQTVSLSSSKHLHEVAVINGHTLNRFTQVGNVIRWSSDHALVGIVILHLTTSRPDVNQVLLEIDVSTIRFTARHDRHRVQEHIQVIDRCLDRHIQLTKFNNTHDVLVIGDSRHPFTWFEQDTRVNVLENVQNFVLIFSDFHTSHRLGYSSIVLDLLLKCINNTA